MIKSEIKSNTLAAGSLIAYMSEAAYVHLWFWVNSFCCSELTGALYLSYIVMRQRYTQNCWWEKIHSCLWQMREYNFTVVMILPCFLFHIGLHKTGFSLWGELFWESWKYFCFRIFESVCLCVCLRACGRAGQRVGVCMRVCVCVHICTSSVKWVCTHAGVCMHVCSLISQRKFKK